MSTSAVVAMSLAFMNLVAMTAVGRFERRWIPWHSAANTGVRLVAKELHDEDEDALRTTKAAAPLPPRDDVEDKKKYAAITVFVAVAGFFFVMLLLRLFCLLEQNVDSWFDIGAIAATS